MDDKDLFPTTEGEYGDDYKAHLLSMYQQCVDLADRVSERRQSANGFYLSVNAAIVAGAAYVGAYETSLADFPVLPASGIAVSAMWIRNIQSYKTLNSGKFKVITALEKKLPASPFHAEWEWLDRGKKRSKHVPFHAVEQWVPTTFIVLHAYLIVLFIFRLLSA